MNTFHATCVGCHKRFATRWGRFCSKSCAMSKKRRAA